MKRKFGIYIGFIFMGIVLLNGFHTSCSANRLENTNVTVQFLSNQLGTNIISTTNYSLTNPTVITNVFITMFSNDFLVNVYSNLIFESHLVKTITNILYYTNYAATTNKTFTLLEVYHYTNSFPPIVNVFQDTSTNLNTVSNTYITNTQLPFEAVTLSNWVLSSSVVDSYSHSVFFTNSTTTTHIEVIILPAIITLYVGLNSIDNAADLVTPNGMTNSVYIYGNFSGLPLAGSGAVITAWDLSDPDGEMQYQPGKGLYMIRFTNNVTSNSVLSFNFANGTPGEGAHALNEEQQSDLTPFIREATVKPGERLIVYLTNDIINNMGGNANALIYRWKNVYPTYSVSNVTLQVVGMNLVTNDAVIVGVVNVGDNISLWGTMNNWSGAYTTAFIQADDNAQFTINYSGTASLQWHFRSGGVSGAYDNAGEEFYYAFPQNGSGGTFTVTNRGSWHN